MDNTSVPIFNNLKTWVLDDGICVTASFISKFYCENKDNINGTFLLFKKMIHKTIDGEDYVHYETILANEEDLDRIINDSSSDEILGKTLYAVQPKGVLFDNKCLKRDYLSSTSNFSESDNDFTEGVNDDSFDKSCDLPQKENMEDTSNNDNQEEDSVDMKENNLNESSKEKGTKRKFSDDEVEKTCDEEEDLKKRKISEEPKDNVPVKSIKPTKKETKSKTTSKGSHKENTFTKDLTNKEIVTETFVNEDGFLVTKSTVKAGKSQLLQDPTPKSPLKKSKSSQSKVPQKQTLLSNFFTKKN
ncbi:Hypothetical protein SRAE_1000134900 [Strongyloides ratti]|uniref:DNA polymerase delta subunit 3 n=1 Tax=Strongyloides ratti TaxID=34506 RepID=A0A090L6F1_STRRB|nr:Hypothetical protein SRAE_1000134900 [Strongyloides ratti]CEF63084.1 Hypothetical protein SRAE_1000134900 [Strongyloides ratti]